MFRTISACPLGAIVSPTVVSEGLPRHPAGMRRIDDLDLVFWHDGIQRQNLHPQQARIGQSEIAAYELSRYAIAGRIEVDMQGANRLRRGQQGDVLDVWPS